MTTSHKSLLWAMLTMMVLAGPIGCGKKEIDELKTRLASAEKELTDSRAKLAEAEKQAAEARAESEQALADLKARNTDLAKVRVERDKYKQELTALKKRR